MYHHAMQSSRFELKYLVDEQQAMVIRNFLRGCLQPDPYTKPDEGNAYWVYSLYFDSPSFASYHASAEGLKNRFKLRIRFYDDNPAQPVFFEIKRRLGDVVKKERAGVQRSAAQKMLWGHRPQLHDMPPDQDPYKAPQAMCNFSNLYERIGAQACVYVYYQREAYVAPDNDDVRVTFDRHVQAGRFHQAMSLMPPRYGLPADIPGVILELKFTNHYPLWMEEFVRMLNLWRVPMPKYVACLRKLNSSLLFLPPARGVAS